MRDELVGEYAERHITALESIARSLEKLANPVIIYDSLGDYSDVPGVLDLRREKADS